MKKLLPSFLLSLLFAGASFQAQAQTSISAVDYTPLTGDHFKVKMANYITPGSGGANQTWNFSSMVSTANLTNDYVSRAAAPFPTSVPAATVVSKTSQNEYQYLETLPSMIRTHAAYSGAQNIFITYSNPVDIAFPMNYNVPAADAYQATFTTNGLNFIRKGTMTITYDGYGTLITPAGTFNNVRRVKMYDVVKDSANAGGGFPYVINTILETYDYILPGVRYPVARMVRATVGATTQTRGMYLDVAALSTPEMLAQEIGLELYPNPATSELNLQYQTQKPVKITLQDLVGKQVAALYSGNGSAVLQSLKLDVSKYAKGVYLLRLETEGKAVTRKVILQ